MRGGWKKAVELLQTMHESYGVKPDVFHYNAAISACEGGQWELVLQLFHEMDAAGVSATPSHTILPSVHARREGSGNLQCNSSTRWTQRALSATPSHTILPSVHARRGQWERACNSSTQMDAAGVKRDTITYNSAISACEKGGREAMNSSTRWTQRREARHHHIQFCHQCMREGRAVGTRSATLPRDGRSGR